MGRRKRRRKIIRRPKRKIPSIFQCPSCGRIAVSVHMDKATETVTVKCSFCGLSKTYDLNPYLEAVDYYGRFLDAYQEMVERYEKESETISTE